MPTLEILTGENKGRSYELAGDQLVIGREPYCDIVLPSRSVSRQHARIERRPDGFYIEDLGSLNGTYVNGHRVSERTKLNDQDRVQLYETVMTFFEASPESVATLAAPADEEGE